VTVLVSHRGGLVVDPHPRAVGAADPVLDLQRIAALPRARLLGVQAREVVGVRKGPLRVRVLEPLLLGVPEHVLDLGRDVQPVAVRPVLGQVDDAREPLDEVAVLGLGLGMVLDQGFVADADLLSIAREPALQELGRAGC
jgi:hypothetical protein